MAKKDEIILLFGVKFPKWKNCPECDSKLTCDFSPTYYGYKPRCSKCQKKKDDKKYKENPPKPTTFGISHFKEVTGFGYEKRTGRYVGVTDKGKHVDVSETRYDLRKDPHGWRAVGKKVKD